MSKGRPFGQNCINFLFLCCCYGFLLETVTFNCCFFLHDRQPRFACILAIPEQKRPGSSRNPLPCEPLRSRSARRDRASDRAQGSAARPAAERIPALPERPFPQPADNCCSGKRTQERGWPESAKRGSGCPGRDSPHPSGTARADALCQTSSRRQKESRSRR